VPRPNIVILFADDMGYTDVGCFGARGWKTPNLDRLAQEGMRFTNFHVAQAVCSASRAALMTGCYPQRVGISGALNPAAKNGMPAEATTLAELLKEQGYATAIVGKWHLGCLPEFLPVNHGFDEWLGLPYSNDYWPVDYDGTPVPDNHRKKKWPPLPLYDGLKQVDTIQTLQDQDTLTTRYTERAVDFLRRSKGRPFFLYFAHSMPHVPLGVSEKFRGKSGQGLYGDMMMEFDWSVGEVMKTLREIGAEDNTLVVFTSDNGPWLNYGNHAGTCDGLREGKGTAFEGGTRVPCIMRWPDRIPAGTVCDRFAATIDLFPTVGKYCGGQMKEQKLDGVDIAALLEGDPEANPHTEFWYYYEKPLCAVTDGRWKLVVPHQHRSYAGVEPGKDGWPGPTAKGQAPRALYDIQKDPGETVDLQAEYPEIVERLENMAARAGAEFGGLN
jgi:arylsulfatase